MVEDFANAPTMVTVYQDGKKVASTLDDGVEIYGKDLDIVCLGGRIRLFSHIPYRTGSSRLLLAVKKGILEIVNADVDPEWPEHCDDPGVCSDPEATRYWGGGRRRNLRYQTFCVVTGRFENGA